jgi:hypothetical protein
LIGLIHEHEVDTVNKNLTRIINLKETLDRAIVEWCKAEEIPLEAFGKIDNPDIKHDHCKTNRKQKLLKRTDIVSWSHVTVVVMSLFVKTNIRILQPYYKTTLLNKCWRKSKGQSWVDNSETLPTSCTQDTGQS